MAAELRERSLVLCDDLEQWNGDGVGAKLQREGTYMHIELIHIAVEQK